MPKQKDSPRVFISHSARDRSLARVLAEKLRAAGLQPWIAPAESKPGRDLWDAITSALKACQAAVFLITPQSMDDPNMMVEAGAALATGKRIILVSAGVPPSEIPSPLRAVQPVSFDRFDSVVRQLESELAYSA